MARKTRRVIPLPPGDPDAMYAVPMYDYVISPPSRDQDHYLFAIRARGVGFRLLGYADGENEAFEKVREEFKQTRAKSAKIWWEKGHGRERRLEAVETLRKSNPRATKGRRTNPIEGMPGGSVTGCIEMHGDKDDPGAYCAAIADRVEPGWRSKKRKRKSNPSSTADLVRRLKF